MFQRSPLADRCCTACSSSACDITLQLRKLVPIGCKAWCLAKDILPDRRGAGRSIDAAVFGPSTEIRIVIAERTIELGLVAFHCVSGAEEMPTGLHFVMGRNGHIAAAGFASQT